MLKKIMKMFFITLDGDAEMEIIQNVKKNVGFHGMNLWVLVFAIFVASLGLNTSSTAVIIGAMLISPLMGPIIGMGTSIGINDLDLLKRSVRNYLVATVVSVITAVIYFTISPIKEATPELIARTSPTIYDVMIAFFGGAAGIVAIIAREKGNVVPGVAIATALMPPLCTAGFGIASGKWDFFFGAFYLFFINTVFISFATFIGIKCYRFKKNNIGDTKRERNIRLVMPIIAVLTLVPSIFFTYKIVSESLYSQAAKDFINKEFNYESTKVVDESIDFKNKTIDLVLVGQELDGAELDGIKKRLSNTSKLEGTNLFVRQSVHFDEIAEYVDKSVNDKGKQIELQHISKISQLEDKLAQKDKFDELSASLKGIIHTFLPSISSFSIIRGVRTFSADSIPSDTTCYAIVNCTTPLSADEKRQFADLLQDQIGEKFEVISNYSSNK